MAMEYLLWLDHTDGTFTIEASELESSGQAPTCPVCGLPIYRVRNSGVWIQNQGLRPVQPHELGAELNGDGDVVVWRGNCTDGTKLVIFND